MRTSNVFKFCKLLLTIYKILCKNFLNFNKTFEKQQIK